MRLHSDPDPENSTSRHRLNVARPYESRPGGENRTSDTQSENAGANPAGGTNHYKGETMDTHCPRCHATYALHKGQDTWGDFTECRICGWHLDHLQPAIPITREMEKEQKNDNQDQV